MQEFHSGIDKHINIVLPECGCQMPDYIKLSHAYGLEHAWRFYVHRLVFSNNHQFSSEAVLFFFTHAQCSLKITCSASFSGINGP
jgi:hypothetical protein